MGSEFLYKFALALSQVISKCSYCLETYILPVTVSAYSRRLSIKYNGFTIKQWLEGYPLKPRRSLFFTSLHGKTILKQSSISV